MRLLLGVCLLFVFLRGGSKVIQGESEWWQDPENDEAYQEYIAQHYDPQDVEAHERAAAFACGICQVIVKVVDTLVKDHTPERDIKDVLLSTCDETPSPKNIEPADALMVCKRVVNEHVIDMVDALSVGDGYNELCMELEVCYKTYEETMSEVEKVHKAKEAFYQEQQEAQKKKKKHTKIDKKNGKTPELNNEL